MTINKKILLTVFIIVIGVILMMAIQILTGVRTLGWPGAIIAVGIVTVLSRIWKPNQDKDKQD
jgi:hypothetical protein